ncbi:MAG: hypothetical protein WCV56_08610, partial [Candidatus Omnitrophota bacterium]
ERALDDRAGMVPYGTGHRGSEVVRRAKIFSPGRSSVPRRECQTLVSSVLQSFYFSLRNVAQIVQFLGDYF